MEITLSDGQIIVILAINLIGGAFDWRRKEGYAGACVSQVVITDLSMAEAEIKAVLEAELVQG